MYLLGKAIHTEMPQQIVDGVLTQVVQRQRHATQRREMQSDGHQQHFPNTCHLDRKRSTRASNIIQIPWHRVQRSTKTRQTMGKCPRQNQDSPISSKTFKVPWLQERRIAQCVQQLCLIKPLSIQRTAACLLFTKSQRRNTKLPTTNNVHNQLLDRRG